MLRVVLESPFGGDIPQNLRYARRCLRDCLERGEAPIASHMLYTQEGVLRDNVPEERTLGIAAGHAWIAHCDYVVVYMDYGISCGMTEGLVVARAKQKNVSYRMIGRN